jgi:MFS family permease
MFASPLGEKIGARKSLIVIIILFSFFTAVTPTVSALFFAFVAVRFLLGIGEGIHFPMMSLLTKTWFPPKERSRANGIWISGVMWSTIIAPILLVPIIEWLGWRGMFYFLGVMGLLISVPLVYFFVFNSPREHPQISRAEVEYIEDNMEPEEEAAEGFGAQIRVIAKKPTYWVLMLAGIMNNMAAYGLIMWLPTYFVRERGLDFGKLTFVAAIPYLFSILGIAVMAFLGDRMGRRSFLAGICYIVTAVITYFAATAPTIPATVILFSAAIFFQMAFVTNEFAILQHILPKERVGTGTGFYNGMAMLIGGGVGPIVVGQVVSMTGGNYTAGIMTLMGMAFVCGVIMLILSRIVKY